MKGRANTTQRLAVRVDSATIPEPELPLRVILCEEPHRSLPKVIDLGDDASFLDRVSDAFDVDRSGIGQVIKHVGCSSGLPLQSIRHQQTARAFVFNTSLQKITGCVILLFTFGPVCLEPKIKSIHL